MAMFYKGGVILLLARSNREMKANIGPSPMSFKISRIAPNLLIACQGSGHHPINALRVLIAEHECYDLGKA